MSTLYKKQTFLKVFLILFWACVLTMSDAYTVPYLLIACLSLFCVYKKEGRKKEIARGQQDTGLIHTEQTEKKDTALKPAGSPGHFHNRDLSFFNKTGLFLKHLFLPENHKFLTIFFSLLFSAMVMLANYPLFSNQAVYSKVVPDTELTGWFYIVYLILLIVLMAAGGYLAAASILSFGFEHLKHFFWKENTSSRRPYQVFLFWFLLIAAVDLIFLFGAMYPGNWTSDSISQVNQIFSKGYTNHHPFYHTMIIRLFLLGGMKVFGNINAGAACYCTFQVLVTAAVFAWVQMTLYEAGVSKTVCRLSGLFFLLMPFNIMYSFTVYKDVPFALMVLLFITSLYRIITHTGKHTALSWILTGIGAIGTCLFRSNGLAAFAVFAILFALLFWKKRKACVIALFCFLIASFGLKNVTLKVINVPGPDTIESLSIPLQQMSRAIVDYNDLTDQEKEFLSQLMDLNQVNEQYQDFISDNMKALVRSTGNQNVIKEQPGNFIRTYLSIGLRHPDSYIKAWVDQTKGYWNSGYDPYKNDFYWRWYSRINKNDHGMERTVYCEPLNKLIRNYLYMFEINPVLQVFLSQGVYFWILLWGFAMNLARKNRLEICLCFLLICINLTLLVATPVYAEMRYAYSILICTPVLLILTFAKSRNPERSKSADSSI